VRQRLALETALKAGKVQIVQIVLEMRPSSARLKKSRRIGSKSSYMCRRRVDLSGRVCKLDSWDNGQMSSLGERVKTKTALYAAVAASKPSGFIADFDAASDGKGQHEAAGGDQALPQRRMYRIVVAKLGESCPGAFTGCPEAL
jgi:hypothetical protein